MNRVKQEALRYLGYGKNPPDEATAALIDKGYEELSAAAVTRCQVVWLASAASCSAWSS